MEEQGVKAHNNCACRFAGRPSGSSSSRSSISTGYESSAKGEEHSATDRTEEWSGGREESARAPSPPGRDATPKGEDPCCDFLSDVYLCCLTLAGALLLALVVLMFMGLLVMSMVWCCDQAPFRKTYATLKLS